MTMEQWMAFASIIGLVFIVAELWQVYAARKMVQRVIEDPEMAGVVMGNAMHGWMAQLMEDSKDGEIRRQNFFGLIQVVGQNMMAGATGGPVNGKPPEPVKLKGFWRVFEPFVNNSQIQGMVANKIGEGLANTGKKGVEAVGDKVIGGWKN